MEKKYFRFLMAVYFCALILPQFSIFAAATPYTKFSVDVLLDYGNGTRTWSISVLSTPSNDTVYNATQAAITTLNITRYGDDIFVDAINGVWNNFTSGYWWAVFVWNYSSSSWETLDVACNKYVLGNNDMVAWFYDVHLWPPAPPVNPPVTQVDVLLDYGNGTANWYKDVSVTGVATVFKATQAIAALNYSWWGDDVFVDAINEVWNNFMASYYWLYWYWDSASGSWDSGPVACTKYLLNNGDVIAWFYETDPWGPPAHDQLTITSLPITGAPFTINGIPQITPYIDWLVDGSYAIEMPQTYNGYVWSHWLEDGDTNRVKTITLPGTTWTAVYTTSPPVGGTTISIKSGYFVSWITSILLITSVLVALSICLRRKQSTRE